MSDHVQHRIRMYGNITSPRKEGVLGLSALASVIGVIVAILVFVTMPLGIWVQTVVVVLGAGAMIAISWDGRHGRKKFEELLAKHHFKKAERQGFTSYAAGPTSQLPSGDFPPVGILARTELIGTTPAGSSAEKAMIWNPANRTGTVIFGVQSPGMGLLDQGSIDVMVDQWGIFQREAGVSSSLVQVAATTQATRDPGNRLPDAVRVTREQSQVQDAPGFARDAMDEIVRDLNQGVPKIDQWVAATFSARPNRDAGTGPRAKEDLAEDIATLLPGMLAQLRVACGGTVSVWGMDDVVDQVHTAYNPAVAPAVETARLAGQGTGLTWCVVGPTNAKLTPGWWEHGGYFSKSWQMYQPPAANFRETGLAGLLSAHGVFEQKRVTLLFRPMSPGSSQKAVQEGVTNARFGNNQKGQKASQIKRVALEKAEYSEREQAEGAAMVRFGLVVTATVDDPTKFPRVEAILRDQAVSGIQLRLRDCEYSDDAAYAFGLGIGAVPKDFTRLSNTLRESV
ncbi:SCO6880 family protein [Corynebacterium dentalis]|uniref:SCO6880 family protein n=1 Tax=Corynebacterium dentalis TaxID=2014528 RepID=UPI00289E4B09|nr:SCO6880 family protein [Corynebacterium dentalis]